MAPTAQRFPERVGEKANQDVGLYATLKMVPDRTQHQIALVDAKRGFGLGQLHVGAPQILAAPVGHVAAQQITSLTEASPITPVVALAPLQVGRAARVGLDAHMK